MSCMCDCVYVNVCVIVRVCRCTKHTVYGDGLSSLSDVFFEVEAYQLGKHSDEESIPIRQM